MLRIREHRESALSFALRRWRIRRGFRRAFGRPLDERHPVESPEKVQYRKLYGNHALYAFLADKHAVREFVAERVGPRYLVPLYGVYDRLTPEVFADLPDRFIIKATHGCKWHQIVRDKSRLDVAATVRRFNQYVRRTYGRSSGQYHYRLIPPRIVIEELLDDGGDSPPDYDFFCYHDADGFDHSLAVVMPGGTRAAYFHADWSICDLTCTPAEAERVRNPPNSAEMLDVAERLSRGFDFLRIDLYNVAGRVYFGEVTCTPAGGVRPIKHPGRAARAARLWKLDRDNRLLYSTSPTEAAPAA
ncbi:MAG: ATP-grasp fold amidoligase family protein [Planctomycetaceae bacterium]